MIETDTTLIMRLGVAIAIGLLVGMQRGWRYRHATKRPDWAGVRTMTLVGFLGGLAGYLGTIVSEWVILVLAAGVVGLSLLKFLSDVREGDTGATTEVAFILVFVLGLTAVRGDPLLAGIGAVVMVAFLAGKRVLHGLIDKLEAVEISAFIQLLVLSVVILPFLPNEGFGPGAVLNPFQIWLMVVILEALAFSGHFAIRIFGAKAGPVLMGAMGGMASSTAVTVSAARLSAQMPGAVGPLAAAVVMATSVMFVRALILVAILNHALFLTLTLPIAIATASILAVGFILWQRGKSNKKAANLGPDDGLTVPPPSDLSTALKFALVLAVVTVLTHYASLWLGDAGLLAASSLGGLIDIDAVLIALSGQDDSVSVRLLAWGGLVAIGTNMATKTAIAGWFGGRNMAIPIGIAQFSALASMALVLLVWA